MSVEDNSQAREATSSHEDHDCGSLDALNQKVPPAFADFIKLTKLAYVMTPSDKAEFRRIRSTVASLKQLNEIPSSDCSTIRDLVGKYGQTSTSELRQLSANTESLQAAFPNGVLGMNKTEDIPCLVRNLPDAGFFFYENKVGNWKPVLIVETDGRKYVIRRVTDDLMQEYAAVSQHQRLPDVSVKKIEGKNFGFFEFLGDQTADFSDFKHLEQIADHGIQSTKRRTAFDENPGNFVVRDGAVFYVDRHLRYGEYETLGEALFTNIYKTIGNIPYMECYSNEYKSLVLDVINLYKAKLLLSFSDDEMQSLRNESFLRQLDEVMRESFHFCAREMKQEDFEEMIAAVKTIFTVE